MVNVFEDLPTMHRASSLSQLEAGLKLIILSTDQALSERSDYYARCRSEIDESERADLAQLTRCKADALASLKRLASERSCQRPRTSLQSAVTMNRMPVDAHMANQDAAAFVVRFFGKHGALPADVFSELEHVGHDMLKYHTPRKAVSNALNAATRKGVLTKIGRRFYHKDSEPNMA
jgi:hypothetical protein